MNDCNKCSLWTRCTLAYLRHLFNSPMIGYVCPREQENVTASDRSQNWEERDKKEVNHD